jgi:NAD dependent epimerase/dehydratase family enzyme
MKDFAGALGRALHRPSWAAVPAAALRLALGEFADALLSGQRALPSKLQNAGFHFRFAHVDAALTDLFGR